MDKTLHEKTMKRYMSELNALPPETRYSSVVGKIKGILSVDRIPNAKLYEIECLLEAFDRIRGQE